MNDKLVLAVIFFARLAPTLTKYSLNRLTISLLSVIRLMNPFVIQGFL